MGFVIETDVTTGSIDILSYEVYPIQQYVAKRILEIILGVEKVGLEIILFNFYGGFLNTTLIPYSLGEG